jgi:hypothetical protein
MNIKLYKDSENNIFNYPDDGSKDHLIGKKKLITQAEADVIVAAKIAPLLAARTYSEKRESEYPNFAEFLDAWVKDDQAALDAYKQKCLAVKAKYPKE